MTVRDVRYWRRLGYRLRRPTRTDLRTLLATADVRLVPLNRAEPERGHWYGACPACHQRGALWVDPGQGTYQLLCGCHSGEGNVWSLLALLLRGAKS